MTCRIGFFAASLLNSPISTTIATTVFTPLVFLESLPNVLQIVLKHLVLILVSFVSAEFGGDEKIRIANHVGCQSRSR